MSACPTKRKEVAKALGEVYDPELPVDICALGLIYDIGIEEGAVRVLITLTSVGCPAAELIPADIKEKIEALPWVTSVEVVITFSPPYHPAFLSEEAKLALGWA